MSFERRPDRDKCKKTKGCCENLLLVEFEVLFDVDVEIVDDSVEVQVIDVDDIDDLLG